MNRRSTIDARLLAVGQQVHGDMLMWGPTGGAEAVAQQLYGSWFAAPQISMLLADLPDVQSEALSGLLALWQELAPVSLDGSLSAQGSERSYDLVHAERTDLGRRVVARYSPVVIALDRAGEVTILNATGDESVVIRIGTGLRIVGGSVRNASAVGVGELEQQDGRLLEVQVPAYGSLTSPWAPPRRSPVMATATCTPSVISAGELDIESAAWSAPRRR